MNHPYATTTLGLNILDRAEWVRYERANHKAKHRYYQHRERIDGLQDCLHCGGLTYAPDGIHTYCKRRNEED